MINYGGVTNNSSNIQTVSFDQSLAAPQQFNAASGDLSIGGAINNNGNRLTVTGSANTTLAGAISGAGALLKTGSGILIVSGNNTYSGATTVAAGKLLVNGTHTGGDRYTVLSGATLGGGGSTTAPVTVDAGAFLDPALGGTLGVGSATLNGTLDISIDESTEGVVSVLDDADVLDISSATSSVDFDVVGSLTQQAYVFATYGSLIGSGFANVLDLPSGYTIDYSYQGQQEIALVAVPEPIRIHARRAGCAGPHRRPPKKSMTDNFLEMHGRRSVIDLMSEVTQATLAIG